MRKIAIALMATLGVLGCKSKDVGTPVEQILSIGVQAEQDLAANQAERESSKDLAKVVELGKQEKAIIDSATSKINALLGGKGRRLPIALGKSTDSLPVNFAHGSIGIPDFFKGEFKINLQISGTGKRPLPTGTDFQLVALDSLGKQLASKDANMVDSAKIGDTLYAGGMFKGSDIKGLSSVAAK